MGGLPGKTSPRWRTAAILKIDISPYLSKQEGQRAQCSGTHGTDESLNKGVAVSFTVKLEVPAQVYILAIFTTFLFPLETPLGQSR